MSRPYCEQCGYPQTACVCGAVSAISPRSRLLVLQHPSEVEHAKNSVRLLQLAVPSTRVVVGETEADFAELRAELTRNSMPTFLLYPSDESQLLQAAESSEAVRLILLDGTWRKTLKMYRLNPWLQALPQKHLSLAAPTAYRIRKASRSDTCRHSRRQQRPCLSWSLGWMWRLCMGYWLSWWRSGCDGCRPRCGSGIE